MSAVTSANGLLRLAHGDAADRVARKIQRAAAPRRCADAGPRASRPARSRRAGPARRRRAGRAPPRRASGGRLPRSRRAPPETPDRRRAPSPRRRRSADCSSIARSGVRKCFVPSSGERNSTPSSVTRRREARLITWKPPESVRIARGQPMKAWRPPAFSIVAGPGPRHEVIGVGQHDAAIPGFQPVERHALDRAPGAHRHEARRFDLGMGRAQPAPPGRGSGVARVDREQDVLEVEAHRGRAAERLTVRVARIEAAGRAEEDRQVDRKDRDPEARRRASRPTSDPPT